MFHLYFNKTVLRFCCETNREYLDLFMAVISWASCSVSNFHENVWGIIPLNCSHDAALVCDTP